MLIEELQAAGGNNSQLTQQEIEKLDEAGSDDGDWEDDPDSLDLGSASIKADLMAFGEDRPYATRERDDETQTYLIQFFQNAATKPEFGDAFNALTQDEREKLQSFG